MNDEYYIVDDDLNLITLTKLGERDDGRLFELRVKDDSAPEQRVFVFPVNVLSDTVVAAYQSALARAEVDFDLILRNFTRLQNQKDLAQTKVGDLQEKINSLQ